MFVLQSSISVARKALEAAREASESKAVSAQEAIGLITKSPALFASALNHLSLDWKAREGMSQQLVKEVTPLIKNEFATDKSGLNSGDLAVQGEWVGQKVASGELDLKRQSLAGTVLEKAVRMAQRIEDLRAQLKKIPVSKADYQNPDMNPYCGSNERPTKEEVQLAKLYQARGCTLEEWYTLLDLHESQKRDQPPQSARQEEEKAQKGGKGASSKKAASAQKKKEQKRDEEKAAPASPQSSERSEPTYKIAKGRMAQLTAAMKKIKVSKADLANSELAPYCGMEFTKNTRADVQLTKLYQSGQCTLEEWYALVDKFGSGGRGNSS